MGDEPEHTIISLNLMVDDIQLYLPLELLLVRPEESCEQRDALASEKLSTPPHLVHDDSDEEEVVSIKNMTKLTIFSPQA